MNNKKTGILLSVLGILSIVLITAGVTYALFSYTKQGTTDNVLKTGTLTFLYTEGENGIDIQDATPTNDSVGMNNTPFTFVVSSDTTTTSEITYDITARKSASSTLGEDQVKVYLTATEATGNEATTPVLYDDLKDYSTLEGAVAKVTLGDNESEKLLYRNTVPTGQAGYTNTFNLRMWIKSGADENTVSDYSPYEFVLKTASEGKTEALKAEELIEGGSLITSTEYYKLAETTTTTTDESTAATVTTLGKNAYERIAYVNNTDRTIYTVSQTASFEKDTEGNVVVPTGFSANEQFYLLNNRTFTVRVNVYANAAVVDAE